MHVIVLLCSRHNNLLFSLEKILLRSKNITLLSSDDFRRIDTANLLVGNLNDGRKWATGWQELVSGDPQALLMAPEMRVSVPK